MSGSLAAPPAGGGPRAGPLPLLEPADQDLLRTCLVAQPSATLSELATALIVAAGPALSRISS